MAEDLGVAVLRGFAAVAHIRQEDDVGIDAVATILEPEGPLLFAGSSFAVQIKSASIESVIYQEHELDWFVAQEIPLFFARVDLNTGAFTLYPTSPGRRIAMNRGIADRLEFVFGEPSALGQVERGRVEERTLVVPIGPPLLTCDEREARSDTFASDASALMKEWLKFEYRNIQLGRIGKYLVPTWSTGVPPQPWSEYAIGHPDKLIEDMRSAEPYLDNLAQHIFWADESEKFEEAVAFLLLARWLRAHGVETESDEGLASRARWPRRSELLSRS